MLSSLLSSFVFTFALSYPMTTTIPCLWHNNSCVEECPEWMEERVTDCNSSYWTAMRTCANQELVYVATSCGFSRCDCPDDTVLDTDTGYCYDVDNCPPKHYVL